MHRVIRRANHACTCQAGGLRVNSVADVELAAVAADDDDAVAAANGHDGPVADGHDGVVAADDGHGVAANDGHGAAANDAVAADGLGHDGAAVDGNDAQYDDGPSHGSIQSYLLRNARHDAASGPDGPAHSVSTLQSAQESHHYRCRYGWNEVGAHSDQARTRFLYD